MTSRGPPGYGDQLVMLQKIRSQDSRSASPSPRIQGSPSYSNPLYKEELSLPYHVSAAYHTEFVGPGPSNLRPVSRTRKLLQQCVTQRIFNLVCTFTRSCATSKSYCQHKLYGLAYTRTRSKFTSIIHSSHCMPISDATANANMNIMDIPPAVLTLLSAVQGPMQTSCCMFSDLQQATGMCSKQCCFRTTGIIYQMPMNLRVTPPRKFTR